MVAQCVGGGGGDSGQVWFAGLRVRRLHNERSAAGTIGALAVPVLGPLLLQVDVGGGVVVGAGVQSGPVAPQIHEI